MATPEQSISQRELRNDSARIMREVKAGQGFTVTVNGEPVARLAPLEERQTRMPITRPATRVGGWSELPISRVTEGASVQEMLDDLRSDRV